MPALISHFFERHRMRRIPGIRVMDDDVEAREFRHRSVYSVPDIDWFCNIGFDDKDTTAFSANQRGVLTTCCLPSHSHRDIRACRCQRESHATPDSSTCAGDQRRFAGKAYSWGAHGTSQSPPSATSEVPVNPRPALLARNSAMPATSCSKSGTCPRGGGGGPSSGPFGSGTSCSAELFVPTPTAIQWARIP